MGSEFSDKGVVVTGAAKGGALREEVAFASYLFFRGMNEKTAKGAALPGVELDRDKLAEYAELYKELGGYTYDRDPVRPDWYAILPEQRHAAL
jgi:glucarate dehydratase